MPNNYIKPNHEVWHKRFLQQASWTASIRHYLLTLAGFSECHRILEVGCGTGAVLQNYPGKHAFFPFGLDLSLDYLQYAIRSNKANFVCGNGLSMPFPKSYFDIVFCHYFILWVDAHQALKEMVRVTRKGGYVIAFAEPDYGRRIIYPPGLEPIGKIQYLALRQAGAEPNTGRVLSQLFHSAGLSNIRTGIIGAEYHGPLTPPPYDTEWETLRNDVSSFMSREELLWSEGIYREASKNGSLVYFIPTFFAIGQVQP